MINYYYVKISCPKNYDDDNGKFYEILSNSKKGKKFSDELTNIPNNLSNAQDGDYVFLLLGGDSSNKRKYLKAAGATDITGYKNGIYAIGVINSRDPKKKSFVASFYPFSEAITKLDLYLYPQFIDNLGCVTKGIPNQAGLYQLDKETSYGFIEYLLTNSFSGRATKRLKKIMQIGSLRESAKQFYDNNSKMLQLPSSDIIKNLIVPRSNMKEEVATLSSDLVNFNIDEFIKIISNINLIHHKTLPYRFISSLQTKPFTILTGLSGSGKTKLAEAFSSWICEDQSQICMVAVGADWTNREPLLGFPNSLESKQYVKPDSGVLDVIISASKDPKRPYFLILDEMNMSHVERYFADFLSAMESTNSSISLHSGSEDWNGVPPNITLPKNLFIIGTVNIDETTYMFSPKVLDRANVIEFRVSDAEMKSFFDAPKGLDMDSLRGAGATMGESFVAKALETGLVDKDLGEALMPFFAKLQEAGAEFGYRTAVEMSRFVTICFELADGEMDKDSVIDAAIMQKLLPKLHGSRNKIEHILKALGQLCLDDSSLDAFSLSDDKKDKHLVKYVLSYEKLMRMHNRVIADGFTSFAEA